MALPIIVPGTDFQTFAWAHSPDVPTQGRALKPVRRLRSCAKNAQPINEVSRRERLVSRWRAIARSRPVFPPQRHLKNSEPSTTLGNAIPDSHDRGANLLCECEWLLRLLLRKQWTRLCHAERVQVHAVVDRFPWQSPVFGVATITTNAAAWMLFAMYWCGTRHPASLFQKPLHPPTGLVRWVSRFRVEQQITQADEIQRRLAGDLRVAAHQCGLLVRRMAKKTGRVALLRELCDF